MRLEPNARMFVPLQRNSTAERETYSIAKKRKRASFVAIAAAAAFALAYPIAFGFGDVGVAATLVKSLVALSLAAALFVDHRFGPLPVVMMLFYAAGDALIDLDMLTGGIAILMGHTAALGFFARHARPRRERKKPQRAAAWSIALSGVPLALLAEPAISYGEHIFMYVLTATAACAWVSRFTRYRVGIGAVLLVVAAAFFYLSRYAGISAFVGWTWPFYAAGLILITVGIVRAPRFPPTS